MNVNYLLYSCSIFNIILVIFHLSFWKVFKWKETLAKGTKANAVATQIMNIQLIIWFAIMAFIYLFYTDELIHTKLGHALLIGYALFWIIRFIQQFIFLKIKGSFVIKLTILFLTGAIIHTLPLFLI